MMGRSLVLLEEVAGICSRPNVHDINDGAKSKGEQDHFTSGPQHFRLLLDSNRDYQLVCQRL